MNKPTYIAEKKVKQENEVMEKHSMQKSEDDNPSCQNYRRLEDDEGLEQETDINIIERQKDENSLILTNDSKQINHSEVNVAHSEGNALVEDKLLKSCGETAQQRAEITEKISISPAQNLALTAEDGNAVQDSERTAKDNQSQANMVLQQRRETPEKLPQAEVSHQTCKALADNVKVTEKIEQQGSIVSAEVLQTKEAREKSDETPVQELMLREQMLREALSSYCRQNKVIIQQAAISHQENTLGSNNLVEKESQKQGKILTPGELEDNGNEPVRELGENLIECSSESGDGIIERSQKNKMASHPETKEGVELEYCGTILARVNNDEYEPLQPSKGYVTLLKPNLDDAITRVQKSKDYISELPRRVDNATVGPQKTKDYVARIPQKLDVIAHSSKTKDDATDLAPKSDDTTTSPKVTKDYKTLPPRTLDVTVQPSKTKDYVTVQSPKLDTVTMHAPFSKDYKILKPQTSHNAAAMDPVKAKDYVTVPPRDADDATTRFQKPKDHEIFIPQSEEDYTFAPSSKREGYVVVIPVEKKDETTTTTESDADPPEPPTHIFWPVNRFQEIASVPMTPTQVRVPPRVAKENGTVPESEEPHHVPERNKKIKMVSPHLEKVPIPQCQKRLLQDDDVPLVSFVDSYESVVQSEPEVLRNRIMCALLSLIPTRMREFFHTILRRIQSFFNRRTLLCCGLLFCFLLVSELYILVILILNRHHII